LEQPSANILSKTPPKTENHSAASSSTPRKRRSYIETADSSSKKPKSEQRALVKSPSVTDMEVTTTALSDNNGIYTIYFLQ
jgi:hypothetical protein